MFTSKTGAKVREILTQGYLRRTRALASNDRFAVVRLFMT